MVEFGNDTGAVRDEVRNVVETLLAAGVPPEALFEEVEGRGDENEEVEPLANELELQIRDAVAKWEHSHLMDEVLNTTKSDLFSGVV